MSWQWVTSLLPDNEQGAMNAIIEATITLALNIDQQIILTFYDEAANVLDEVTLASSDDILTLWDEFNWDGSPWDGTFGGTGGTWGVVNWGAFNWGSAVLPLEQIPIAFHVPIVFRQGVVSVAGPSAQGFAIGNLYMGYEVLGYMLQRLPG
jgi:hypothetical protein